MPDPTSADPEAVAEWYVARKDFEHAALIDAVRSVMRVDAPHTNAELREYVFPLVYEIGRLQSGNEPLRAELDALRAENQQLRRMAKGANMEAEAELDSLRKAVASYENGITWQTTCLKCAETIDKSATIHLGVLEERDQLRARLVQTEAVVEAASAMLGVRGMEPHTLRPSVNRLRAALRALPEAPPVAAGSEA